MKNLLLTMITVLAFVLLTSFSLSIITIHTTEKQAISEKLEIPENVKTILDNSCLQCHGEDGKFKAKMKWNFENMLEFDDSKLISKLSKIEDEVSEGKMPPKKYVKKNPEHKLSKDDIEVIVNWASSTAEELSKN
ncbi:MAG: hypothetical protein C0598_11110 [Marinilabiliales bacterium]|nr:MAG: hypothetical protein C0598_11110 [Marinilabiliales bacterium]